jgi:hypothetical protein
MARWRPAGLREGQHKGSICPLPVETNFSSSSCAPAAACAGWLDPGRAGGRASEYGRRLAAAGGRRQSIDWLARARSHFCSTNQPAGNGMKRNGTERNDESAHFAQLSRRVCVRSSRPEIGSWRSARSTAPTGWPVTRRPRWRPAKWREPPRPILIGMASRRPTRDVTGGEPD